jgi:hypothetical protein
VDGTALEMPGKNAKRKDVEEGGDENDTTTANFHSSQTITMVRRRDGGEVAGWVGCAKKLALDLFAEAQSRARG